ncbi:TetR/AcrR family transcriptional regulator [Nesterenkonia rhizosphaerae]|uniref:HTH tetR-type domain-containing protein n=1 Tax=Nesterenkonia rhizosphaerae TaxID=1348272 RepID=A0ABP9G2A0_9MICC
MASMDSGKAATFTQQARRDQIIDMTIALVDEKGYAGVSLSGIAERAGITKAAVLYHFSTKAAVVEAAYQHVLQLLVAHVGKAVDDAGPAQAPEAYVRSMLRHLRENRQHTRMMIEAMSGHEGRRDTSARWRPLAELIRAARAARGVDPHASARSAAVIIGGAIDSVLLECLNDPDFDGDAAADQLINLVRPVWSAESA